MADEYQQEHLKSLTGLRFIAALSVFFAHSLNRWPIFDQGQLPFGAAGVSFFFLLSGFILTYVYGSRLRESAKNGSVVRGKATFSHKSFYVRRFARIWPIHIATLLVSLFLVIGADAFFAQGNSVTALFSNLLLVQSWIPNYSWIYALNGPSWSLAVEAFFYLVFPFLLLGGARNFSIKYALIALGTIVAVLLLSKLVLPEDSWVAYNAIFHTNPLMRLFEFATGMGSGFCFLSRSKKTDTTSRVSKRRFGSFVEFSVVALMIAFFAAANWLGLYQIDQKAMPLSFYYWFRFCGAAPVFALVIYVFACGSGRLSKLLSSRVGVYLGGISYSFYMIHMPVMILMMRHTWLDSLSAFISITFGCLAISIFLAACLYHLVEVPFRKSIVEISEGANWSTIFFEIWRSFSKWLRSPAFVITLTLALVGAWFVSSNSFDVFSENEVHAIVQASESNLKDVKFEDDATLLGANVARADDGSMDLKLVWRLQKGRRAMRLIKLLDKDEKILGQANQNRALFDEVVDDRTVIDWVKIDASKMKGVKMIVVSFFEKERKLAKVDSGPRSFFDHQLNIWVNDFVATGEASSEKTGN